MGKPQWPGMATLMPDNSCEHGYMLAIYIDTIHGLIANGYKSQIETLKVFLQAILTCITKTK